MDELLQRLEFLSLNIEDNQLKNIDEFEDSLKKMNRLIKLECYLNKN